MSNSFSKEFLNAMQAEFRRSYKISFYAWCYSSYKADIEWQDFKSMYKMGI